MPCPTPTSSPHLPQLHCLSCILIGYASFLLSSSHSQFNFKLNALPLSLVLTQRRRRTAGHHLPYDNPSYGVILFPEINDSVLGVFHPRHFLIDAFNIQRGWGRENNASVMFGHILHLNMALFQQSWCFLIGKRIRGILHIYMPQSLSEQSE